MSQSGDVARHLLRTILLVGLLAVAFLGSVALLITLRAPAWLVIGAVMGLVVLTIYGSARWHGHSAPIADRVDRLRWTDDAGTDRESVVELAKVRAAAFGGASVVRSNILRVSVYTLPDRKRTNRTLIGDDAVYLGRHGDGFWFFIRDRFHARKDGLVCIDPRDGSTLFHRPKRDGDLAEARKGRAPVIELVRDRQASSFDLRAPTDDGSAA